MTAPIKSLLERLAIELGTHMINIQIANMEVETLTSSKSDSDEIVDGMKKRIITLEIDIKALRAEVISFREPKVLPVTIKKSAVISKK